MSYTTAVRATDTGMVIAEVYAPDGERVGLEFFNTTYLFLPITEVVRRRLAKGKAWAEAHEKMLEENEVRK